MRKRSQDLTAKDLPVPFPRRALAAMIFAFTTANAARSLSSSVPVSTGDRIRQLLKQPGSILSGRFEDQS